MRISYRWLKEFVDIDLSAEELAFKITMAGLEVDSVEKINTYSSVVGEIIEIKEEGNLYLAKVDIGDGILNIATADKSVNVGDKFPVVRSGAFINGGIRITKRAFGNFVSEGMMLSSQELGLEDASTGLFRLDNSFKNGTKLEELDEFDDYLIEIEFTPNRADALSILGVARDVRALLKKDIRYPEAKFSAISSKSVDDVISVEVQNYEACPRYTMHLADVEIDESPFFIRSRLLKSGIRPINNVVDITNYVLMAFGQPMHAFDLNRLSGNIVVRKAKKGEKILALDEKEYELDENMLVIADNKSAIAIAGVMGGEDTGVIGTTKTIALESAFFDPVSVRLTSRKLKIHTDSSHRFERGVDPNLCLVASSYALSLLEKYSNAKIYKGSIDKKKGEFKRKSVVCSFEGINNLLGTGFSQKDITDTLEYLDFSPEGHDSNIEVSVPTYRFDIDIEADIAEEVARIIGYDKVPSTFPVVQTSFNQKKPVDSIKHILTKTLADMGLYESVNYSFIDSEKLKYFDKNTDGFVYLKNPLIEGQDVMRTTLVCGLLDNLAFNITKNSKSVALFEIGRVFFKEGDYSKEFDNLGVLMWGVSEFSWHNKEQYYDFYDMKAVPEAIEKALGISFDYERSNKHFLHPGRSAELILNGKNVGFIGELHPDLYDIYDIKFDKKSRIIIHQINLNIIADSLGEVNMYEKLPKLPTVVRDLALVVDKPIFSKDIEIAIRTFDNVYDVVLFDMYDKLEDESKKSLAFRIMLKNDDKTFTDKEIDKIINDIFVALKDKFSANLRG
jgi:phenylalanyl-tRNA synthetase beta chain